MGIYRYGTFLLLASLLFCCSLVAQDDKMIYASPATTKSAGMPIVPSCMTVAALHGDYTKGAATLLLKFTSGCKVPWHWHTAAENIILVSGTGKIEMKDGPSHAMKATDYAYLPAKQPHQFTCTTACIMYDLPDGAFDIHYIDKDGKEIPPEQALKSSTKGAKPASKATKKM